MKGEDEGVATQRLLEVIRGQGRRGGGAGGELNATKGVREPTSPGHFGHPDGLILTPALRPRSWLPGRVRVGLDIGTHAVKMVRLERGPGGPRLLQLGMAELFPKGDGSDAWADAQVAAVRALLKDFEPRTDLVVTSVSDPGVIVRHTMLPRMPAKDLARTIPFEARKHLPHEPGQVTLRYQVTDEGRKGTSCQVLLVAVPNSALGAHRSLLSRLGIEPYAIEVGPLALANAYLSWSRPPADPTVLVDIGGNGTGINIQREGGVFFSRQVAIGGETFTKGIQSALGISREDAEDLKRGRPAGEHADVERLTEILSPAMSALLLELRRSLIYYDNVSGRQGFSRILLSGGGALVRGLGLFLEENLGVPVELMDPFSGFHGEPGGLAQGELEGMRPLWAVAAGLATRR